MQALEQSSEFTGLNIAQPTFDTQKFVENNRIHIEHGSLISSADPLLPLHPRELAPENEAQLRAKITRAYTTTGYSFFENDQRAVISAALGSLVPLSAKTKEEVLGKGIASWLKELQTGEDPTRAKDAEKMTEPFKAVIAHYLEKPEQNPANIEFSKNAVAMYLMMEEALHERGFKGSLGQFAQGVGNAEGLVAKLSSYLGYETHQFMETARKDGLNGAGAALGLEDGFVRDVKKLGEYLEDNKFSVNAVMNWKVGRNLPGMKNAGTAEQIDAGAQARVNAKIIASRVAVGHQYDVPAPIRQTEQTIAGMLKFLPPELSETLFRLGAEIAYTPEHTVRSLAPEVPAYGFHRRVVEHPDDVKGIYQIFVSGKNDAEEAVRVIVHEAHHLLLPGQFRSQEVTLLDGLANHDMMRLKALKELMDGWMAGDDATKAQVVSTLNRPEFSVGGSNFSQSLGPAEMLTFYHQVQHAYDRLQIDSEFYHKGGYTTPESRFQEINSRYAELRYVRERENPEMLAFIVPGLTVAYEQIYLPHVREQLQELRARDALQETAVSTQQAIAASSALPANVRADALTQAQTDMGVTSHPQGAAQSTIEAASAELVGQLVNHTRQTVI